MNATWQTFLANQGAQFSGDNAAQFSEDARLDVARAAQGTIVVPMIHLGAIRASGEDACAFLHNLFSNDVKKLGPNEAQFTSFNIIYSKDPRVTDTRRLEVKYRQYLLNGKLKNQAEQDRLAKDLIASFPKLKEDEKKNDRAMLAFAHARFASLEPTWKGYTEMKFKKIATFKTDLALKQKKLTELENAYTEVLKVGNPEFGIAALTRIGLLYSDLATNINEMPDPPGLDEDQLALFRSELENRYIFPLEDKAVEALEKSLVKSYELSMYNEWTLLAQDKLNKYKPGFYGKPREVAYRGSEFFATAGFEKKTDLPADPVVETPPAPAPNNSAAAPTPGAGRR